MRTVSRSGRVVIRVENVPATVATAHAIINDERHDNGTGRALTISNVLRPTSRDYAVTTNSASCIAPIAPVMSDDTASLLTAMISRG